jgi:hypothetical protein
MGYQLALKATEARAEHLKCLEEHLGNTGAVIEEAERNIETWLARRGM